MRGPTGRLGKLVDQLATTEELFLRLRQEGAVEARKQVRRGFAEGRDPYGNPWAPLKLRQGVPLNDTGRLAEFSVRVTETGFVLTTGPHPAPQVHQYGATIKGNPWLTFQAGGSWYRVKSVTIPRRQMVPEGTWGDIWEDAFAERFEQIVGEWARAA